MRKTLIPIIGLILAMLAAIFAVLLDVKPENCMLLIGIVAGMLVMGALMASQIKRRKYDGYLQYNVNDEGKEVWTFVLNGDPNEWHDYDDILLKVQENPNV